MTTDTTISLMLFPFRAVISLFYCLWQGLCEWRNVLLVQWRYLEIVCGKTDTIPLEQWLWERDQEVEMPEQWDTVSFWGEYWGVVENIEVWDDNTLRFDVRVSQSYGQRYLRPHEVDKIIRRKEIA